MNYNGTLRAMEDWRLRGYVILVHIAVIVVLNPGENYINFASGKEVVIHHC